MAGEPIEPRPLGPSLERREPLAPARVPRVPEARWVEIGDIEVPEAFRLRPVRGVAPLAEAIARDGQREPLVLRERPSGVLELIEGHRRLEALRLLRRRQVLVRVHHDLDDAEALYLSLTETLEREPVTELDRRNLERRLGEEGRLDGRGQALFDRAERVAQELAHLPDADAEAAGEVEEIELEDLAARTRDQLADSCNDLAALHEVWGDLDEGRREDLVDCVRYLAEMLPLLREFEEEESP